MPASPLIAISREGSLPLSGVQQDMWAWSTFFPNLPPYYWHVPSYLDLAGPLDTTLLRRSVIECSQRHEAIRTTFFEENGRSQARISPSLSYELPVVEVADPAEADQLCLELYRRPFDLSQLPLYRGAIVRYGEERYTLVLIPHHLIVDAWSQTLILREFFKLYKAFLEDRPSPLPDPSYHYADYVAWEKRQPVAQKVAYWQRQLQDMPRLLELPTDRPRPLRQDFSGQAEKFTLSAGLLEKLPAFNRGQGVTLFVSLLGAFYLLLYKYTRQLDIVVGIPVANRELSAFRRIVGCFAKILPMRLHLSERMSGRQMLGQIEQLSREMQANQAAPFNQIGRALNIRHHPGHQPLYQVNFVFQNAMIHRFKLPGLAASLNLDIWTGLGIGRNDIVWQMFETGDEIVGVVEYQTALFDRSTIQALIADYQRLLTALVAQPEQAIIKLLQG